MVNQFSFVLLGVIQIGTITGVTINWIDFDANFEITTVKYIATMLGKRQGHFHVLGRNP